MLVEWFSEMVKFVVGLAWPAAFVVTLVLFRRSISRLFETRSFKIGRGVVEIGPAPQSTSVPNDRSPLEDMTKLPIHDNPLIRPYLEKLESWSREKLAEAEKIVNVDREPLLIRGFAGAYGALHLERAYWRIFGSQIMAIEFLQQQGGKGALEHLRIIYDQATQHYPTIYPAYSFESWLQYMKIWNLIEVSGDQVTLTPEGTAFLPHIAAQGYPARPLG